MVPDGSGLNYNSVFKKLVNSPGGSKVANKVK